MTRLPLTSRGNLVLADLRTRRERWRDFWRDVADDVLDRVFTISGAAVVCALFLVALIVTGFVP